MIAAERPLPASRQARRLFARVAAALVAAGCLSAAGSARADEPSSAPRTDYCRKVVARAEADAALLFAPTASVQLIRYPQSSIADAVGIQVGSSVQPRASVSLGLVDIYKGVGVKDVAQKDCLRQESAVTLQEVVLQRDDAARKVATEAKVAYLRAALPRMDAILRDAEARFSAGVATLTEVHELRRRVLDVSFKIADAERMLESLKAKELKAQTVPAEELLRQYETRAAAYEESLEHVKNIQPWKMTLTGGAAANPQVDYFAVAELSYNFGGLFQQPAEARGTAARIQEIRTARYEMRWQLENVRKEARAQAEVARRQVGLLDAEIARVNRERATVEGTDAPNKPQVVAALTLETIDLEGERTFLNSLAEKQSAIGGRQ
ncbi:MAG: hypothetical protein JWP97_973 [Labilithrix sp.]|nr:hypothetical protein [Labilithrix sp.]